MVITPNTKTGFHLEDKSPRIPARFLKIDLEKSFIARSYFTIRIVID